MPQKSSPAIEKLKRTRSGKTMEEKTPPKLLVSGEETYQQIEAQIEKGKKLRDREINLERELKQSILDCKDWVECNKEMLLRLFNDSSIEKTYSTFFYHTHIQLDTKNLSRTKDKYIQFMNNLDSYRVWVGCHIDHLRNICIQHGINTMSSNTSERIFGDKIFIVHGHNEGAKHKIARFIENLDLTATILDEQPIGHTIDEQPIGHTIIDKFEEHAGEAGFAILLLTADDIGAPKDQEEKRQPRARQNVILEFGYFLAELGRKRIGVLYEEGVELPSDIKGLEYVPLDNTDGWKIKLAKGMRAAGFTVDLNKI